MQRALSAGWTRGFDSEPEESSDEERSFNIDFDEPDDSTAEFARLVHAAEQQDPFHVPQENFDLSQVPEQAEFVETPFTIAKRVAAVKRARDPDDVAAAEERPAKRHSLFPFDSRPSVPLANGIDMRNSQVRPAALSTSQPARRLPAVQSSRSTRTDQIEASSSPAVLPPPSSSASSSSASDRLARFRAKQPLSSPPDHVVPSAASATGTQIDKDMRLSTRTSPPSSPIPPRRTLDHTRYHDLPQAVASYGPVKVDPPKSIARTIVSSAPAVSSSSSARHGNAAGWSTLRVPLPHRNPYSGPSAPGMRGVSAAVSSASLATRFTLPGLGLGFAASSRKQSTSKAIDRLSQFKRRS